MYEAAIEILENHNRTYRENVDQWEREADPHRMNQVRLESLRQKINEIDLAITHLKQSKQEPVTKPEVKHE